MPSGLAPRDYAGPERRREPTEINERVAALEAVGYRIERRIETHAALLSAIGGSLERLIQALEQVKAQMTEYRAQTAAEHDQLIRDLAPLKEEHAARLAIETDHETAAARGRARHPWYIAVLTIAASVFMAAAGWVVSLFTGARP